jgi:hypothetical protein
MKTMFAEPAARLALLLTCCCLAACGHNDPVLPPLSETLQAVAHGASSARIYGPAGTADAGTTVAVQLPATGTTTAASDGSFALDVTGAAGVGSSLTLSYTKQGKTQAVMVTLRLQAALVSPSLFATGAAPNDIALGGGSL